MTKHQDAFSGEAEARIAESREMLTRLNEVYAELDSLEESAVRRALLRKQARRLQAEPLAWPRRSST